MTTRRSVLTFGAAGMASGLVWPGLLGSRLAHAQPAQKRFALVIGNNSYPASLGALRNAVSDAQLVARVLGLCGFEAPDGAIVIDGDKKKTELAVRAHASRLNSAGPGALGFVYYAGHGAARPSGDNYIIPILDPDIDIGTASVWDNSIGLEWLLGDALANIEAPQIISIDACRNELRTNERGVGGGGSFIVRGLDVVASGDDANMFLSFATWQGQTASDGGTAEANGPYSLALASSLTEEGPILNLFDKVRRDVKRRTDRRQEVMNVSRLSDEASEFLLGGLDPAILPSEPVSSGATGGARGVRLPVNLALCISCGYAGQRLALPHARADADKVASALRDSDFEVERLIDPATRAMGDAIEAFADQLRTHGDAAVAVLHFSGHSAGIAPEGNFLFGEEPLPTTGQRLAADGLPLSWVVNTLAETGAEAVVIFLDACRSIGVSGAIGKMRATNIVTEHERDNVFIAFSVAPDADGWDSRPVVAVDGPEGSHFAQALSEEIRSTDRRDCASMLSRVSEKVRERSQGRMHPTYVATAPIYFRDGRGLLPGS